MILPGEERLQIARLFNFLLQGEQLAFDCARQQAEIFSDPVSKRFLRAQARQEALHARIFKAGIGILRPRGTGEPTASPELENFRSLVQSALDRGDCAESLLGMQIIFEGLGDIALTRISDGFSARGLAFRRVRQLVVGQEDAHHSFGLRQFQQLMGSRPEDWNSLRYQCGLYLEVLDSILATLNPLFEYFEEEPADYMEELLCVLPARLRREAA